MKKKLLLLPNVLGDVEHHELFLPASVDRAVKSLSGLIAESDKGGRKYLSRFIGHEAALKIPLALLNEHTKEDELDFLLEPVLKGEIWGVVSDCGLPCIADPGARLVARSRELGITLKAFSGPSSIFLGLMLSGLGGQRFSFHGYPPRDSQKLLNFFKTFESRKEETHIFIEAPYRNTKTLELLVSTLSPSTHLAVGWDLTLKTQGMVSTPVSIWRKSPLPNIHNKPSIFLIKS